MPSGRCRELQGWGLCPPQVLHQELPGGLTVTRCLVPTCETLQPSRTTLRPGASVRVHEGAEGSELPFCSCSLHPGASETEVGGGRPPRTVASSCSARTGRSCAELLPHPMCLVPRSAHRTRGASARSSASPSTPRCTTGGGTSGSPCTPVPHPAAAQAQRAGRPPPPDGSAPGDCGGGYTCPVGGQVGKAAWTGALGKVVSHLAFGLSREWGKWRAARLSCVGPSTGSDLLRGGLSPPTGWQRPELTERGLGQTTCPLVHACRRDPGPVPSALQAGGACSLRGREKGSPRTRPTTPEALRLPRRLRPHLQQAL